MTKLTAIANAGMGVLGVAAFGMELFQHKWVEAVIAALLAVYFFSQVKEER